MISLLLAATLASSASALPSPLVRVLPPGAALPPGAVLTPDGRRQLYAGQLCQRRVTETLAPAPNPNPLAPEIITPEGLKKLGDLPPGLLEHAVNRMINGCPVREIVFGGQTYYLDMPVGKFERTDPVVFRRVQH